MIGKGGWTHAICWPCYSAREPDSIPVRLKSPVTEICCFCGDETDDGIYYRYDGKLLQCGRNLEKVPDA